MKFSKGFFSQPVSSTTPAGAYLAITRVKSKHHPFLLGTSLFCPGNACVCRYSRSFYEIMHVKIAIDSEETEDRRAMARIFVKTMYGGIDSREEVADVGIVCAPEAVPINVFHFHFPVDGNKSNVEHAVLCGPYNLEQCEMAMTALEQAGVCEHYVTTVLVGNSETPNSFAVRGERD